jgi:hypothetical protein
MSTSDTDLSSPNRFLLLETGDKVRSLATTIRLGTKARIDFRHIV